MEPPPPVPHNPAAVDIVEICRDADWPWGSGVARGFWVVLVRDGGKERRAARVNERILHVHPVCDKQTS
ncbi:hypothetical protein EYF80_036873 [Liparis tanakae]|uniref:Uncharacterized protein n=1 Tax=Liparis tanakae TaxID=230148 RepID=A0A4Z2GIA5_9TELE|nr:hypothetical protein EYF80_036873 [Liparis tanakae]